MTTILALDTNVFLHYRPIDTIDWCAIAGTDEVTLLVCMRVVQELDEKKHHPLHSDRADRALRQLWSIWRGDKQVRAGVVLQLFTDDVDPAAMPSPYVPSNSDDVILHLVKTYADRYPSDVSVITGDYSMLLRAELHKFKAIQPPEEHKLPIVADEITKAEKRTRTELEELKNRRPRLAVGLSEWESGRLPARVLSVMRQERALVRFEDLIAQEERRIPAAVYERRPVSGLAPLMPSIDFEGFARKEVERFNAERATYVAKYREYLLAADALAELKSRCLWISLWVTNAGSCPADDVYVVLRSGPGLAAAWDSADDDKFLKEPGPPTPPKKVADSPFGSTGRHSLMPSLDPFNFANIPISYSAFSGTPSNISSPSIRALEVGTELVFHARRVRHDGEPLSLGEVTLVLEPDCPKVLPFQFTMTVSNLPAPESGQLVLKFDATPDQK